MFAERQRSANNRERSRAMKLVKKSHEEMDSREMSVDSSFFCDIAAFAAW